MGTKVYDFWPNGLILEGSGVKYGVLAPDGQGGSSLDLTQPLKNRGGVWLELQVDTFILNADEFPGNNDGCFINVRNLHINVQY